MSNDFNKQFWHELYIEMLANPSDNRSDADFCRELNINTSTLCMWKTKYREDIYAEADRRRKNFVTQTRAKLWKKLDAKTESDTNALKLAFQLLGDLVEKSESKIDYQSREDKIARAKVLWGAIESREKTWKAVEAKEGVVESGAKDSDILHGGVEPSPGENPAGPGKA